MEEEFGLLVSVCLVLLEVGVRDCHGIRFKKMTCFSRGVSGGRSGVPGTDWGVTHQKRADSSNPASPLCPHDSPPSLSESHLGVMAPPGGLFV